MMVDCDSQQDLTELVFRAAAEANSLDVEAYLESKLPHGAHPASGRTVANLADAVRFVLQMDTQVPNTPIPVWGFQNRLLKPFPFPAQRLDDQGVAHDIPNLFHVAGGSGGKFEDMETKLASLTAQFNTADPNRSAQGALFHAIWNAGFDCGAEVIILDLSPALGPTNQVLLMHSDHYAVSCTIDKLCEKNLKKMTQTVADWYKIYEKDGSAGISRTGFRDVSRGLVTSQQLKPDAECPLPEMDPKFAGLIMNRYDVKEKCVGAIPRKRDRYTNIKVNVAKVMKRQGRSELAFLLLEAAAKMRSELNAEPGSVRRGQQVDRPGRLAELAVPATEFERADDEYRHNAGSSKCLSRYFLAG